MVTMVAMWFRIFYYPFHKYIKIFNNKSPVLKNSTKKSPLQGSLYDLCAVSAYSPTWKATLRSSTSLSVIG